MRYHPEPSAARALMSHFSTALAGRIAPPRSRESATCSGRAGHHRRGKSCRSHDDSWRSRARGAGAFTIVSWVTFAPVDHCRPSDRHWSVHERAGLCAFDADVVSIAPLAPPWRSTHPTIATRRPARRHFERSERNHGQEENRPRSTMRPCTGDPYRRSRSRFSEAGRLAAGTQCPPASYSAPTITPPSFSPSPEHEDALSL